jgi:hypothetical protein
MLVKSYLFISFSSYCKFMSHVRFVSSSFSFWVDLCENDIVFWVNDVNDVNCRFWVNKRVVIFSFSNNSWFNKNARSTILWKEEIDDDDDILFRNVISRSNLLTSLTNWILMLEEIFNSCQKARLSTFFNVWIVCKSYFCSLNWFKANRKIFRLCDFDWICQSM